MFRWFIIFCCFVLLCRVSRAEEPDVVAIDKITITDKDVSSDGSQNHSSQTIEVKTSKPSSATVADEISRQVGIHIRRYGGLEAATAVSIRGSSQEQVQIVLDDIPLETASGDGIGLDHIPLNTLSKIEIYKTFTPSDFGGGAVGGVINLKSKEIAKGVHQRHGIGFGSFFTFDAESEITRGSDKHDWLFGIDYRRTNGDFTFLDDNGTPVNTGDDARVKRQNNEQQVVHPHLKWNYRFDERTELSFVGHVFRTDSGVPGVGTFQSTTADLSTTEVLTGLNIKRTGYFSGTTQFKNNLSFRFIKSQFTDTSAEIGLGTAQDNDNKTTVLTNRLLADTVFSKKFSLKDGIEFVNEWFLSTDFVAIPSVGSSSKRAQLNFLLEPHFKLGSKINVLAQLKLLNSFYSINNDDPSLAVPATFFSSRNENQLSGTAAVNYEPLTGLVFKASGGRVVRLPKFVEMFGDQGFVLGNPQLISEKSFKFDGGVAFAKKLDGVVKKINAEFNYFESHVTDLIQFEQSSGFARAGNIGSATIRGIEFSTQGRVSDLVTLAANYTFQLAKDGAVNPGNFLVGRPKHEINTSADLNFKNFEFGVRANFIDDEFLDALNTQRVDNRILLHATAAYLFKSKYRLAIEAKNLSNSQVVDSVGFPLPGRSFFARFDTFF